MIFPHLIDIGAGPVPLTVTCDTSGVCGIHFCFFRQFLFRETDIGRPKSSIAAAAVSAMNPSLQIKPYEAKCGQETEELFSDDFYSGLSVSTINSFPF